MDVTALLDPEIAAALAKIQLDNHSLSNETLARIRAAGNKNGFIYIVDRETGKPINPIVETPGPTATDTPGEEPWPTQPIPQTTS